VNVYCYIIIAMLLCYNCYFAVAVFMCGKSCIQQWSRWASRWTSFRKASKICVTNWRNMNARWALYTFIAGDLWRFSCNSVILWQLWFTTHGRSNLSWCWHCVTL